MRQASNEGTWPKVEPMLDWVDGVWANWSVETARKLPRRQPAPGPHGGQHQGQHQGQHPQGANGGRGNPNGHRR
jgi:hypothetical protein